MIPVSDIEKIPQTVGICELAVKLKTQMHKSEKKGPKCFYFTFLKVMPNIAALKCVYNPISALKVFF